MHAEAQKGQWFLYKVFGIVSNPEECMTIPTQEAGHNTRQWNWPIFFNESLGMINPQLHSSEWMRNRIQLLVFIYHVLAHYANKQQWLSLSATHVRTSEAIQWLEWWETSIDYELSNHQHCKIVPWIQYSVMPCFLASCKWETCTPQLQINYNTPIRFAHMSLWSLGFVFTNQI